MCAGNFAKKNKICNFVLLKKQKTMNEKIALVAVAYNRTNSLARLLKSLEDAFYDGENVPLIISIDKSNTDKVERYADFYEWPHGKKTVVKHNQNLGLKTHILGLGRFLDDYDAIVVLEDDVTVARDFWFYVRKSVSKYSNDDNIAGISLYSYAVNPNVRHPFVPMRNAYDAYFIQFAMSWGQVWMRRQWKNFEQWLALNDKFPNKPIPNIPYYVCSWNDKSWLKHHIRYCVETNRYFVYPYISYSTNNSEPGVHMHNRDTLYQVALLHGKNRDLRLPDFNSDAIRYDAFFENQALYEAVGVYKNDCCIDLQMCNNNQQNKRYWLTTRYLPYAVLKTFDFALRPIENNVLENAVGSGIYLYDTHTNGKYPNKQGNQVLRSIYFIQNVFLFIREYGYANVVKDFVRVVKDKFNI